MEIRGLLYALLSGFSGALFAQAYKFRTRLEYGPRPVIAWFAVWFSGFSALLVGLLGSWRYSLSLLTLGVVFGISFVSAIYLYMRVSEKARLNISWTIVQTSVVLPFGLSIIIFDERPDPISWVGIVLIGLAICIFAAAKWRERNQADVGDWQTLVMLIASSILTGLNLSVPKILHHVDPGGTIFSLLPYAGMSMLATALMLNFVVPARRPTDMGRSAGRTGGLAVLSGYMAVTTSAATICVYYALESLAGSIVYPIRNVVCVVVVTLLAAVLFRERAAKLEMVGIGIALCGIALISAAL